jgi:hypothetical protein
MFNNVPDQQFPISPLSPNSGQWLKETQRAGFAAARHHSSSRLPGSQSQHPAARDIVRDVSFLWAWLAATSYQKQPY